MASEVKSKTVLSKSFDSNRIVFASKTTAMNDGGTVTSCKVSYDYPDCGEGRLIMQSAKMKAPFGATSGMRFSQPDKWSIQLSFRGEDKKSSIARFRKAVEALDQRLIEEGLSREKDIAGQTFDDDDDDNYRQKTIKKSYKSKLKFAKEGTDYPDTFQISIPWDKNNNRPRDYVKFYDSNNEEITWESLLETNDKEGHPVKAAGTEVVCLFEVSNVWTSTIGSGTFGPSIKLVQMKICSSPNKVSGFQIVQEDEEDDDVEDEESVDVEDEEEIDDVSD